MALLTLLTVSDIRVILELLFYYFIPYAVPLQNTDIFRASSKGIRLLVFIRSLSEDVVQHKSVSQKIREQEGNPLLALEGV